MTRISRIKAPRATFLAFALLTAFMLGFVLVAEVGHGGQVMATKQDTTTLPDLLKLCWGM